jgi:hypothetical protein
MKKKKIIIIVVVLVLVIAGVILWLYLKKKKATTVTTQTGVKSALPETSPIVQTTQTAGTTPILQTSAGKFTKVIRDGSKGMAILRHEPASIPLAIGNSVTIPSGAYAGTFKVLYIYDGRASGEPNVKNIYIETPYKGDASGTFTKA